MTRVARSRSNVTPVFLRLSIALEQLLSAFCIKLGLVNSKWRIIRGFQASLPRSACRTLIASSFSPTFARLQSPYYRSSEAHEQTCLFHRVLPPSGQPSTVLAVPLARSIFQ